MSVALTLSGRSVPAHLIVPPANGRAPAIAGTGLGAPEMVAFRHRLEACLTHVRSLWPHANVGMLRSALCAEALRTRELLLVSDNQLSAFLLYAAETQLIVPRELVPMVDVDSRTQQATLASVETVKGMIELMKRAGAKDVTGGTVYAADVFHQAFDDGQRDFRFEPNLSVADRGPILAFFAVVDRPRGEWHAKVLSVPEVHQARRASRSPDHRAWRDYFPRMGELTALRAIAEWIPQGFARPRSDVSCFDDLPTRPMVSLDPDNPYATAPTTSTADYTITEEPLFADANAAAQERLPGEPHHFGGWGGRAIGGVPAGILRGVRKWIAQSLERRVKYARLDLAITLVLAARPVAGAQPGAQP